MQPAISLLPFNYKMLNLDQSFLNQIIFSDECVVHVNGKSNKQEVKIWGSQTPQEVLTGFAMVEK